MGMVIKTVRAMTLEWLNIRIPILDIPGGSLTGGSVKEKEVIGSMIK